MADQRTWPTGQCSGPHCQAPIIWAETTRAERMPVDVEPGAWPEANVLLTARPGRSPLATVLGATQAGRAFGRVLYRAHFATCPDAAWFRRRHTRPVAS